MKTLILICTAALLAGCQMDERNSQHDHYRSERTLAKICPDGTKVWSWNSKLWVFDNRVYPDAEVSAQIDSICG
jgi:hypothetical protein